MTNKNIENTAILKRYEPIADMIFATFGSNCEVVIHDLENVKSSLIYLQGNVTGRRLGAPTTEVILKQLRQYGNEVKDKLGFITKTQEGKTVKTSISFIRNNDNEVIGYLGINFDTTAFSVINQVIQEFTNIDETSEKREYVKESYAKDIDEVFQHLINTVLLEIGVTLPKMSRKDKIRFVQQLEERGAFLIQGSADRIAKVLGVSKQTIYNYLE